MNGIEIENFYNLDDKRYILKENKEFIRWFSLFSVDYELIISIDDMQNLIDEITLFYEIKYPDKMLFDINHGLQEKTKDTIKISKLLNFEQLKYRLHGDYVQFLKCSYQ